MLTRGSIYRCSMERHTILTSQQRSEIAAPHPRSGYSTGLAGAAAIKASQRGRHVDRRGGGSNQRLVFFRVELPWASGAMTACDTGSILR